MSLPDPSTPQTIDPTEGEVSDPHTLDESVELLHDAAVTEHPIDAVVILDYGSQYSQLITRRVREIGVYGELIAHDTPWDDVQRLNPKAVILSGGPASAYEEGAPQLPDWVLEQNLPTLGICYGMQLLTLAFGGSVEPSDHREYGSSTLQLEDSGDALAMFAGLPSGITVWMSHGDRITQMPEGFSILAWSSNSPIAAMSNGHMVGLQFHPEVHHSEYGKDIIRNFLVNVAGCATNWSAESFIDASIKEIRERVGDGRVLLGLSGGVDSSVAAALIHKAIEDQLTPVFVNNGLLREGEADAVRKTFTDHFKTNLVYADASERFLEKLKGVTDPEEKRKAIGETFVRVFESEAEKAGPFQFLAQGTLYPDVIESATSSAGSKTAVKIKTHHNVGGLPEDMEFELLEPFRLLFKDEVRAVGRLLGVPDEIVERQPFPGPGLAVRLLGEINETDLALLRKADAIVREEIERADLAKDVWQYFAVLLPVNSTGVMGDYRTYARVVAVRAIASQDAMTADWAKIPYDVLGRISSRIVNEVNGINRVVYDITSKPPATIEWE
jgi:GMP synthase (glutamine-hydrolysing)